MKKTLITITCILTIMGLMACASEPEQQRAAANSIAAQPPAAQANETVTNQRPSKTQQKEQAKAPEATATTAPTREPPRQQSRELRLFPTKDPQPAATETKQPGNQRGAEITSAPTTDHQGALEQERKATTLKRVQIEIVDLDYPEVDLPGHMKIMDGTPDAPKSLRSEEDEVFLSTTKLRNAKIEALQGELEEVKNYWRETLQTEPEFIMSPKEGNRKFRNIAFFNKKNHDFGFIRQSERVTWTHALVLHADNRDSKDFPELFGLKEETTGYDSDLPFALHTFALLKEDYKNYTPPESREEEPFQTPPPTHWTTGYQPMFIDQKDIVSITEVKYDETALMSQQSIKTRERAPAPDTLIAFQLKEAGQPGLYMKVFPRHPAHPDIYRRTYQYPQHLVFISWLVEDDTYQPE